ncbi:16S rRNA (cytidine(1402)-2'-O)-methyltransferase [Thalassococcus lentus]|uniref:Ribosomal RNA small subunit methyltransferase I n=1 Tax=Thalassococcus lentus TaxID=1210524 RepID=A0ABT4XWF1_9RHOB|nr:16S rRNA (cytidine(1402)-2'-O)-methyltransferase [Thalassococcus lentus]MDA7426284.1 16S rRNA (cytidine(1402)-2'-O)-methyltransferase [Thalassococcus lentus]
MTIHKKSELTPGLFLLATPIGNARDITLRALDILASADVLAAEDTRSLRRLMEIHGIPVGDRPMIAYHDHNGSRVRPRLLGQIEDGKSVAYASEAGTPMISDPGFDLLRAAVEADLPVTAAPGAVAAMDALTLAGLPTDRFMFAGFLPNARGAREKALRGLTDVQATLVFYESPKRLAAMLRDGAAILGGARPAAVCRELTKKFEEVRRGSLDELAAFYEENAAKGEIVVLIGKGEAEVVSEEFMNAEIEKALEHMSVRDVADTLAPKLGLKRRVVYQAAMAAAARRNEE